MKNASDINRNLVAIKQTRQITNAMYLLSVARMKKGMSHIDYNDSYMKRIRATIKDILQKSPNVRNMFLNQKKHEDRKDLFLVLASDKSLCGSYNNNIANLAIEEIQKHQNYIIHTSGIFAAELLKAHNLEIAHEWAGAAQSPSVYHARMIAETIVEMYKSKEIDSAYVVFTDYINPLKQEACCKKLLPLALEDFDDTEIEYNYTADIIYEPSIEEAFKMLVPQYAVGFIFSCLCQTSVSEHIARMNAMQSSTKNADEMIKKLSFEFNQARQIAITNEITEIAAATELTKNAL